MENIELKWLRRFRRQDRKISYSQCGEDLIVDFIFSVTGERTGTYLDIGAHHPTYLNNTAILYKKGWRGVNVDPLQKNMELFAKKRPQDVNICAGIATTTEMKNFYVLDPETLSTFDENVCRRYMAEGHGLRRTERVQFYSVKDLLARAKLKDGVDLLTIDIEGGEEMVIRGLIRCGIQPSVLICETARYSPDLRKAGKDQDLIENIKSLGYLLYADTFVNSIFVSRKFWNASG